VSTSYVPRRARTNSWSGGLVAFMLGLSGVALVHGQAPPALARFVGQYRYDGTREHGVAIVEKALDYALSDMNMLARPIVKRNMTQRFAEVIFIQVAGINVGIKMGDYPQATAALGRPSQVKDPHGRPSQVSHSLDGDTLIQTLIGEDGSLSNSFELSKDGNTLTRSVTIKGEKLKKPIRYKLQYVRK
jgi:hypothetical protein